MRPGSNKRMRGRNRRGPNPLARSYESNGPDVKVRGTAQHIADRYLQLARDAQSSGDPVTAESYFQHAEHYLRIIAAAQDQMQAQYGYRPRPENGAEEEGDGEEGDVDGFGGRLAPQNGGYNGQPRQMPVVLTAMARSKATSSRRCSHAAARALSTIATSASRAATAGSGRTATTATATTTVATITAGWPSARALSARRGAENQRIRT